MHRLPLGQSPLRPSSCPAIANLYEAQRAYSSAVISKVAAAKKKRASAAIPSVTTPSIAGPSVAYKVVLGKAKTKALKAAATAFYTATNAALDAY
ncbi:hypothetical protein VE02_07364 [Pseudogymnoascus sp. 03VT05]|nr:hypothetical protein VE02_07364 [Pseudogymnoascus sp. 03VT05]